MSAATTISNAFGESANLYTVVLALPTAGPSVPQSQIRRAYYKRALLYHPDKQDPSKFSAVEIEDTKAKFHAVSVAYSILSNEESRAEYDETGELYDEDDEGANKSGTDQWAEYFRGIFGSVTVSDIDKFEAKYKCSDEEEKDVLKYYTQFKGDLNKMVECVMLSREEDKRRWVDDYIRPAVKKGSVEDYTEVLNMTLGGHEDEKNSGDDEVSEDESADDETESEISSEEEEKKKASSPPKKKRSKGEIPAKKTRGKVPPKKKGGNKSSAKKKRGGGTPDDDLIAAIRGNAVARSGRSFGSMIAGLEERYGGASDGKNKKKGKRKGGGMQDDIPDEEFERIRASLGKR